MPPQLILSEGSEEELVVPKPEGERKEILYEGWFYDVTEWVKVHPGGKVIDFYTESGEDATIPIQQFHNRSIKKVLAILKSFKKRPAHSDQQLGLSAETLRRHRALTQDFQKLHGELEAEGYFRPSIPHLIYRLSELLILFLISLYLINVPDNLLATSASVIIIATVCGRCGWLMHEGGHNSLTGHPRVDQFLQSFIFGFGTGCSATWWSSQHNRHHAMPQRLEHDVDLRTLPLLAFNKEVVKNREDGHRFVVQHQAKLFFVVDTFLVSWFWKLYLHPRYAFLKGAYMDLFFMSLHYVVCFHYGLYPVLIGVWLTSIYMLGNFTLSHTSLPVTKEPLHWVEYSLLHTMDIQPSLWCNWWMSFLNYQIEHHLFPTMPQFRHPQIRHRVKAMADKHGIPYHCLSYWQALKKMVNNLSEVSQELREMH